METNDQPNFEMLPLVVMDETNDPPTIEIETELPHYSGVPVPPEARVIDAHPSFEHVLKSKKLSRPILSGFCSGIIFEIR